MAGHNVENLYYLKENKKMIKPAQVTFVMKKEEFQFLGREYSLNNPDFGKIWDDFLDGSHGGYATLEKYQIPNQPNMNIWYNKHKEHKTYFIGKIVGEMDKIPDGFTFMKIPASEYFVITYEWVPADIEFNHYSEYGNEKNWNTIYMPISERTNNWECFDNMKNLEVPDGYRTYNDADNKIFFIEVDNFDTPNGKRIEFWVPIIKM